MEIGRVLSAKLPHPLATYWNYLGLALDLLTKREIESEREMEWNDSWRMTALDVVSNWPNEATVALIRKRIISWKKWRYIEEMLSKLYGFVESTIYTYIWREFR